MERETVPERLAAGMGSYPIPLTLLARLAVVQRGQDAGIGTELVLHAFTQALAAAEMVGSRAVTVDALGQGCRVGIARSASRSSSPTRSPQISRCTCS
jgi:hypothetical protein